MSDYELGMVEAHYDEERDKNREADLIQEYLPHFEGVRDRHKNRSNEYYHVAMYNTVLRVLKREITILRGDYQEDPSEWVDVNRWRLYDSSN